MSDVCPCCGQQLPTAVSLNEATLLAAMSKAGPRTPGKGQRDVYRVNGSSLWVLTGGHWRGEPQAYAQNIVKNLAARGLLKPIYPDCHDSYRLNPDATAITVSEPRP